MKILELPQHRDEGQPLARDLEVTVKDASRAGAQLRVSATALPSIQPGSRLVMLHEGRGPGMKRPLRMVLEVRWVGPRRRGQELQTTHSVLKGK